MGAHGKSRKGGYDSRKGRELPFAEDGQAYARVMAMLGNGRVTARFSDGSERLCRIRGTMRRREWVHVGDTVLVAYRDQLTDQAADIVFKYQPAEVAVLQRMGEGVRIVADDDEAVMDDLVTFEGGDAAIGDI